MLFIIHAPIPISDMDTGRVRHFPIPALFYYQSPD